MPTSSLRAPDPEALTGLRAALRASHGLALDGITDAQLWQARLDAQGDSEDPPSAEAVFEHLPISESAMFRNPPLWSWLEEVWLPSALDQAARSGRALQVVSLGCSQGQEVFSLAALAARALRQRGMPAATWPALVKVHGWDASATRVARARSGLVSTWSVRGGKAHWLEELERHGDDFRVPAPLRAVCQFEQHNLLALRPSTLEVLRNADVVLMQHVLVYIEARAASRLVQTIAGAVGERALMIVAAVESHLLPSGFKPISGAPVGVAMRRTAAVTVAVEPRRTFALPRRSTEPFEAEQPSRLVERLLNARALLASDPHKGRALLAALVSDCADPAEVTAPEDQVSAHQVAQAARLLLGSVEP